MDMTSNEIIKHYKKFFDLQSIDEDDHLNIDWAAALIESMKEQRKRQEDPVQVMLKSFAEMVANDDLSYLKDAKTLLMEFDNL